jgi:hypothetical protein
MIKAAPLELPPVVARRFFEDQRAFHRVRNAIKRDEIRRPATPHSSPVSKAA